MPKRKRGTATKAAAEEEAPKRTSQRKKTKKEAEEPPKKKRTTPSRKKAEKEKEVKKEKKEGLDFDNLEQHSISELAKYTTEKGLTLEGPLSRKRTYIQAIRAEKEGKKGDEDEKEELWDVWKQIYLVGTEWHLYDDVFQIEWDFSQLQEDLEEGGRLYQKGLEHPVYLFGTTEPQMLSYDPSNPLVQKVIPVPVVVAIVSSLPPPSTLGLNSVQKEKEEIIPMTELKMDWAPYIPRNAWMVDPLQHKPQAYFLKTSQRRIALKRLSEEQLRRWEYALPYIFLPRVQEEPTANTEVSVLLDIEGTSGKIPPLTFDWQFDELEEFTDQVVKDYSLEEKHKDSVRQQIRDQVNEKKRAFREEKVAWKSRLDSLSEEEKKALDELKCYKYYPKNKFPDLSQVKSNFINRYYGKADELL